VRAILAADAHEATDPPELRRARLQAGEARKKLGQYLDALEDGMDPVLVSKRTRVAQGELASANAVINTCDSSGGGELSEQMLRELLEGVRGLTALLADSTSAERQRVYRAPGVHLRYQRSEEGERVTASLYSGVDQLGSSDGWRRITPAKVLKNRAGRGGKELAHKVAPAIDPPGEEASENVEWGGGLDSR
jgi:hypothetical protein